MKNKPLGVLLVFIIILILSSCQVFQVQFKSLELDAQYNYLNPVWSPTGNSIAFERRISDISSDLWIINDGELTNIVPDSGVRNSDITWSPDGQTIAYKSGNSNQEDIWLVNANGSDTRNLTQGIPGNQGSPHWSPNGQYLAFISVTETTTSDLWLIDFNDNSSRNLTPQIEGAFGQMSWSPNSQFITVFHPNNQSNEVLVVDTINGNSRILIANGFSPNWSKTTDEIIYSAYTTEMVSPTDILIINVDDGTIANLTNTPQTNEVLPIWSPDNNFIAYSNVDTDHVRSLWVLNRENNQTQNITDNLACVVGSFSWSPNSDKITFACTDEINTDVWIINQDGSNATNLTGE